MAVFTGGPLQQSDLLAIWTSTMDEGYTEPFLEAGDGGGLEGWNQAFAQLARVSQAIDTSMGSLYILPWSGQTSPPAAGGQKASVTLTLARTLLPHQPLILMAGTLVDDLEPDYSLTGTQLVDTGLAFALASDLIVFPGSSGPVSVVATAARQGYSYNNPTVGAINSIEQPGTQYYNVDAAVVNNNGPIGPSVVATTWIQCFDVPHVFLPSHVGQYLLVTMGTNAGRIGRAISYRAPRGDGIDGGALQIEMLAVVMATSFAGTFQVGELATLGTTGYATIKSSQVVGGQLQLMFVVRCGTQGPGTLVTGTASGATATVRIVYQDDSTLLTTTPSAAPSTESWRVLDWINDWGISISNAAQPSGGVAAVLDYIGARERKLPRQTGESDPIYRQRVATPSDVVSPNAIRRKLNKVLTQGPLGLSWCLREIGTALFPGFFYDWDAYDYDATMMGGLSAGYQPGEKVTQTVGGIVATGRILISTPPVANVPGTPAAGIPIGVANVRGTFVAGVPVVGMTSGFSSTPASVTPSAGVNNTNALNGTGSGSTLWRIYVDYLRMRGYFAVVVQRSGAGDFGFGWGSGAPGVGTPTGFWDIGPNYSDFYDGFPVASANAYRTAYGAVDAIRMGGVFWELLPAAGPCV